MGRRVRGGLAARGLAAVLIACALQTGLALAAPPEPEALRAFVEQSRVRAKVRGASAAVLREGRILWTGAFGVLRAGEARLVTPDSVFEAASIGKVVAAYGAMSLVEEGRWSLDMPVRTPRLVIAPGCRAPSLAELLSHTAGLGNDLMAEQYAAACEPGSSFAYAGQGYLALQELIEADTGQPAEAFLAARVLLPLGMTRSSYAPSRVDDVATGHVDVLFAVALGGADRVTTLAAVAALLCAVVVGMALSFQLGRRWKLRRAVVAILALWSGIASLLFGVGSRVIVPTAPRSDAIALPSSLHTSANDLARFAAELMRPTLLSEATRDLLLTQRIAVNERIAWGAGIGIDRSAEPTTYWHWGSNPGFQGLLVIEPVRGDAVLLLTNTGGGLDLVSSRIGGYNLGKVVAREALGIHASWDLVRPAP